MEYTLVKSNKKVVNNTQVPTGVFDS